MRGYVLKEAGHAEWTEVPAPTPGPYDAIVRPTAVAVCTTDIHLIATAGFPAAVGKAIGHEAVGIVESVGALVKDFAPGDRVIIPPAGPIGDTPTPSAAKPSTSRRTTPTSPRTPPSPAFSPNSSARSTST